MVKSFLILIVVWSLVSWTEVQAQRPPQPEGTIKQQAFMMENYACMQELLDKCAVPPYRVITKMLLDLRNNQLASIRIGIFFAYYNNLIDTGTYVYPKLDSADCGDSAPFLFDKIIESVEEFTSWIKVSDKQYLFVAENDVGDFKYCDLYNYDIDYGTFMLE